MKYKQTHITMEVKLRFSVCIVFILYTLFLLSCKYVQTSKKDPASSQLPNILLVLADDLGYGDVRAFNPQGKIPTPNLDRIANEGMIFTDAHTSSSVCSPTRYGIITGRYNWRSKLKESVLWGESQALIPDERVTIASLLNNAGYSTAFIGKWHLGWNWVMDENESIDFSKEVSHDPNDLGFEYYYGHAASLDIPPYVYVENGKPTAIPVDCTENRDFQGFWRKGLTSPDFVHQEVTPNFFDRTSEFILDHIESSGPFFIYLALPSPHTPILPAVEWQGASKLNPYGDFVMMIDDYMGKLMKVIHSKGIEKNTLVIFVSDNGCSPRARFEELQQKGHYPSYIFRGHKADIYEGGHRVPFIVKWPEVINTRSANNQTICTTDLFATFAEITRQQYPDNAGEDSYSLMPLLTGDTLDYKRTSTVHHSIDGEFAIRSGNYKLILCPGSGGWSSPNKNNKIFNTLPPFQLYNLKKDPGEKKNLIYDEQEIADSLKYLLTEIIMDGRSTEGTPQSNDGENYWKQLDFMDVEIEN